MEWILALWFAFCIAHDEHAAMKPYRPLSHKPIESPFDELAWRKANGLPTTQAEVDAIWAQYFGSKEIK